MLLPAHASLSPSTSYSMGGHRVVPSADEHFYCATKYAVTALTEGIRQELREANTHIRATVSVGFIRVYCFDLCCGSHIGSHDQLHTRSLSPPKWSVRTFF